MIMNTRAKKVYQGADGSVHFLSSGVDYSVLIITDPKLGRDQIEFDGPVRLLPRHPLLPVDFDGVQYQSVSASGSTMVTVHPGRPPFEHSLAGVCDSCMFGEHDYSVWPVCPGDHRGRVVHGPVYPVYVDGQPSFDAGPLGSGPVVEPEFEPVAIAAPEPVSEPEEKPVKRKGLLRRRDVEPAPAPGPAQPDPVLSAAVMAALRATSNGRGLTAKDRDELHRRLTQAGVTFKTEAVDTVLDKLIASGAVEFRPGVGFWVGNGFPTIWQADVTRLSDIGNSSSWG